MVSASMFEYSHLAVDGIDHNLFAELCSSRLLNNRFANSRYQDIKKCSWKDTLSKHVADVIQRSKLSVTVAIAALILIERFQEALIMQQLPFAEEVEDAGRLFFIAYMVAAKVIHDDQPFIWFWRQVSNYEYSGSDISRMECQFYDVVGWKVQIDAETFNCGLIGMMDSYCSYTECYKLPSAPPAVYQKLQRNQTMRTTGTFRTEDQVPIPSLDDEDEALFVRAMSSPTARRAAQWSKHRLQFFRIVLRATQLS
ncbi:hypothetical protein CVT25_003394 [Psilocybe cyanescens]|uniref:Cyclin N-terminal domain-containing protein n=1 Tax=Psilocybe cyanescens TaxID=93625 RepID=A0A409WLZ8_PSICY|nr:hypothetical protein CVT25_003394 [Psilocybe cyanescens]